MSESSAVGPAAVTFANGAAVSLSGWDLCELWPYDGGHVWQLGGWLAPYDEHVAPLAGPARITRADLPGLEPLLELDVTVDVTGYGSRRGGTGQYMSLTWPAGA